MTIKTGTIQKIPKHLIYEMDEGKPIYYKWYKEYLNGTENYEEIMPVSTLQAWLKTQLALLIGLVLQNKKGYVHTVGELGLSLKKKSWRGADIAIFKKSNFALTNEYAKLPPEVVIEINIKGYYDNHEKAVADFEKKNEQLLEFGVKKIIWVFTDTRQILVLTKNGKELFKYDDEVPVMDEIAFNIQKLIDNFEAS